MARVTSAEVLEIMAETELTETQISPYITSASVLVDNVLGAASLPDAVKKEVERWLAAHMVASTKERVSKKEGAGGAYVEYAGDLGAGLSSTPYGQMAVSLDSSGLLAAYTGGKKIASLRAIKQ